MAGNPYLWSTTASLNSNSDADINWTEGQVPSTVNNSARAMMAATAGWLKDTNGTLTTGGSANAQTVTTNVAYAALAQGLRLGLKAGFTNTAAATLTVTPAGGAAFAAKSIRMFAAGEGDADIGPGAIRAGSHYYFEYDTAANAGAGAWILCNPALDRRRVGATSLYVRTDGSDSNNGLTNTAGGAFLTIQKAIDTALHVYDSGGFPITINVADGTYAAGASITQVPHGFNQLSIVGNVSTPANCVISSSNGITVQDFAIASISGFKFTGAGNSIYGRQFAIVDVSSCTFMGSGVAIVAENASISLTGGITVDANMTAVLYANLNGKINLASQTITMPSARTITYFALVDSGGRMDASATFSGAGSGAGMTGTRFAVTDGLFSFTNTLPGTIAGTKGFTGTNTNDDVLAGQIGEYRESILLFASKIALTTGTSANVTTLSLSAGDWDVQGIVIFNPAAATTVTGLVAGVSSTSATLVTSGNPGRVPNAAYPAAGDTMSGVHGIGIPPTRFANSTTTIAYLVANATFGTDTMDAFGNITARRVR